MGRGRPQLGCLPTKNGGGKHVFVSLRHATTDSPDHPVLVIRTVSSATPHVAAA
jgi:hypothetical protein